MANKTPKPRNKTSVWTESEIKKLKRMYPTKSNDIVAEKIGRSVRSIRSKAAILKLKKENSYWQIEDEKYILENWKVLSPDEMGEHLGRTKWAVINKYRELTGKRLGHKKLPI